MLLTEDSPPRSAIKQKALYRIGYHQKNYQKFIGFEVQDIIRLQTFQTFECYVQKTLLIGEQSCCLKFKLLI